MRTSGASAAPPTRRPDALAHAAPAKPTPDDLRLTLIRAFELSLNGTGVRLAPGSQHLLAYLALNHRAVRRSQVAGTLWGDVSDSRAAGNLRSPLWRLRNLDVDLFTTVSDYLTLSPCVNVDIHEANRIARLVFDPGTDITWLDLDELPFSGELLPGWDDEWVILERERLRQIGLHVLDALCKRWTLEGHFEKAVKAGLAAIASEPLRESSHRALISAFIAEGNPSEAIRTFKLYGDVLRRELNLTPSHALASLISDLASG